MLRSGRRTDVPFVVWLGPAHRVPSLSTLYVRRNDHGMNSVGWGVRGLRLCAEECRSGAAVYIFSKAVPYGVGR